MVAGFARAIARTRPLIRRSRIPGCCGFNTNLRQKIRPKTIGIVAVQPLIALSTGILILLESRIFNYVVEIYFIITSLIGLLLHFFLDMHIDVP